jgi:hypothetical protein
VISKKKIIDCLDEFGLFILEKTVFTKKKSVALPSAVKNFSFRITEGIGLTGVSFHF